MRLHSAALAALSAWFALCGSAQAEVKAAAASRLAPGTVELSWTDAAPVDVYESDAAEASKEQSRLIARAAHGPIQVHAGPNERPYFLLRDELDGTVRRIAERILPLAQGSNFRDVGGYVAADDKHVRWGRIYRTGATPMLTPEDLAKVRALGLAQLVDLRSSEERSLAPTRIYGVPFAAVGYSMTSIVGKSASPSASADDRGHAVYAAFPTLLAPQLKIIFRSLLANNGAVAYNCSAGQDRTGFATAMILAALGVPRDVIYADYELSTGYRRPEFEMPRIDPARASENPAAAYFVKAQQDPAHAKPKPLFDAAHRPWLAASFSEIEHRWGSVDAYLEQEMGLDAAARSKLQALYLE